MAGSSPGTSGRPLSPQGKTSGAGEACPSPCNQGCAPRECIVKLPKVFLISIEYDKVEECVYLFVRSLSDDNMEKRELSLDNFVRTISTSPELEEVYISVYHSYAETLRALCECMKTIPSLKSLGLWGIHSSGLSISDAEAIFSVLGANSTLLKCDVGFRGAEPMEGGIVKVLVDALLQNRVLQQFALRFNGDGRSREASEEVVHESGEVMRELSRYLKAPTNVLTDLSAWNLRDDEVVQLADMLGDNKKLRTLSVEREDRSSGKGMGRIGEALRTNTVLEKLYIYADIGMGGEEMKALVGALIPDATSGLQPNTHLHSLFLRNSSIQGKEGMEQLATLLRSNTSLLSLDLLQLFILRKVGENAAEYAEMLFSSLQSNASLESLDLSDCVGIGGKHVLGMIMDMLLHNRTLREILLERTGLERDGDAEVVYAELRTRDKKVDRKLEEAIRDMEHVPPNSARIFLCGNQEAGKTTLCQKWRDIETVNICEIKGGRSKNVMGYFVPKRLKGKVKNVFSKSKELALLSSAHERTRGIEDHKMIWEDMNISLWDMAGQEEYHTFHDMILPNRSANGECCYYFIVFNPTQVVLHLNEKHRMEQLETDIYYWLVFIASNTRTSKSYLPHVTILMTHYDLWRVDKERERVFVHQLKKIVNKLRIKFLLFLEFDKDKVGKDLEFIPMDNASGLYDDAEKLKQHVGEYLKKMSLDLPKVLKASVDLQSVVKKWGETTSQKPFLKWDVFSSSLCKEVEEFGSVKNVDKKLLDKIKKHVAISLHNGGHIMYFEDMETVILNPHWLCQNIIGSILFNCSKLNDKYSIASNGTILRQDFKELVCQDLDVVTSYEDHFDEILMIMTKLQICYEDGDDKIMIPSLLVGNPIPMNWEVVFETSPLKVNYLGTKMITVDDSITRLTPGFFSRLQVYLRDKCCTDTYKLYSNIGSYKLFSKGISFIDDDVYIFILLDKEGSINILSQCHSGGGDSGNHHAQKKIMNHVNDLRQTPTLGCPGVILEEHILFPFCVENALEASKLQCVSKKQLTEEVLERVLRAGNVKYRLSWVDENGLSRSTHAKELLGDEEWLSILQRRGQNVMKMDKVLDSKLAPKNYMGNSNPPAAEEYSNDDLGLNDRMKRFIAEKFDSQERLMQHNHMEMMKRLDELETNIIGSQEKLAARVCSNIDSLMECLLQLKNSEVPKLPYIMKSDGRSGKRILLKMVPGLTSYHLHFMCEHKDGFHIVDGQLGCAVEIGTDQTRKFGIVMYWGLTISVMLLKVGAHLTAGMGGMVPDLTREFATILDTPGLLDLAQPRGEMLECLPAELKEKPYISLQDNEEAKDWLVKFLGEKCKSEMHKMFKLTKMVDTSKSSKRGGIAWVCDRHKTIGE